MKPEQTQVCGVRAFRMICSTVRSYRCSAGTARPTDEQEIKRNKRKDGGGKEMKQTKKEGR